MDLKQFIGVHDVDYVKYAAGYASEKRMIKAIHKQSGDEFQFKTRTEMYGRKKTKDGGWIGEDTQKEKGYVLDDFEILDIQVPEPLDFVLYTAKRMMEGVIDRFDDSKYFAFMGEGDSFRRQHSTIIEYKGNREGLKPVHLNEISDYLQRKFRITTVRDLEADDWCVIAAQPKNTCISTHDKDSRGCGVWTWNPQKPTEDPVNGRCFGDIWIDTSGATKKYTGVGRKFFYYQVAYGDDVDNYRANAASEVKWGEASAFTALESAKNDKEAVESLIGIYKHLYPEPVEIYGWKGDIITVDWKYAMQEVWDMAHMHRHEDGDFIILDNVFDKLEIKA